MTHRAGEQNAYPKLTDKNGQSTLKKFQQHYSDDEAYSKRYGTIQILGKIFVIDTPPPYPSGTWHIGAVAQYSMIDVIAGSQRLLGKK